MTAPFVTTLRAVPGVLSIGRPGTDVVHLRVQVADVWDTVRIDVAPSDSVGAVKASALAALFPCAFPAAEYAVKLGGFEVLDENVSITDAGARNGSTFILIDRRRRPVK